jgi:hypothetical protein
MMDQIRDKAHRAIRLLIAATDSGKITWEEHDGRTFTYKGVSVNVFEDGSLIFLVGGEAVLSCTINSNVDLNTLFDSIHRSYNRRTELTIDRILTELEGK